MDAYIQKAKDILGYFGVTYKAAIVPPVGQTMTELIYILDAAKKADPSIIVEIGSAQGGFIFMLSYILRGMNKTFISVDPWDEKTKYGKSFRTYQNIVKNLKVKFPSNQYLNIRESSASKNMLNKLKKILNGKKIDFLFIDGDHSYEAVSYDFYTYKDLVKKGGIIALHDIAGYKGAIKVWNKIKEEKQFSEIHEKVQKGEPLLKETEERLLGVGYVIKK